MPPFLIVVISLTISVTSFVIVVANTTIFIISSISSPPEYIIPLINCNVKYFLTFLYFFYKKIRAIPLDIALMNKIRYCRLFQDEYIITYPLKFCNKKRGLLHPLTFAADINVGHRLFCLIFYSVFFPCCINYGLT